MKRFLAAIAAVFACLMPALAFADALAPDGWERATNGDGLIWVLVIAIIVIVAAVLFFVLRKRKKK